MLSSKNTQSCPGEKEKEEKEWDAMNEHRFPAGQPTQPIAIQTPKMQKQHTQGIEDAQAILTQQPVYDPG